MAYHARLAVILVACFPAFASAADWPTWRFDAQRSAASPQVLAENLHLQWVREYPPEIPAWPEQEKMHFDVCYEPIIAGDLVYLNSSRHDCIRALDIHTGARKWIFFAEGPVRFAPVYWSGKLFFTSDDGYLYCLNAETGNLLWKLRGGPSDRKILGNERLISTWPARGAPVIADGVLYFAASIWPFMGVFLHAVDPNTGAILWTNDGDGSVFIKQPHMTDAFAGIAPQGPLTVNRNRLLVPGGRSVPASFDRQTGKLLRYPLAENGRLGGGSDVAAWKDYHFNGGAVFECATGKFQGDFAKRVVLTPRTIFAYHNGACRAYDPTNIRPLGSETTATAKATKSGDTSAKNTKTVKDSKAAATKGKRWLPEEIAMVKTPPVEAFIMAGKRLYAGGDGFVMALDFDPVARTMHVSWEASVPGKVVRLIAGADRLVAATHEGPIYCFGAKEVEPQHHVTKPPAIAKDPVDWRTKARRILDTGGAREGYAVVWGMGNGGLVRELIKQSKLHIIVVDPNPIDVMLLRRQYVAEDWYGKRVTILEVDPRRIELPPYFASLMVCEDAKDAGLARLDTEFLTKAFASLRPYGGTFVMAARDVPVDASLESWAATTPQARVLTRPEYTLVRRDGALPGAANWTHEHADSSNSRVSKDQLVKAPLGILWFGGPSHEGILPRHGHGPQPQVIDGRLLIEGVDLMRALDIYTGRQLWERKLPGVGTFFNNVAHQPGANASGSNFVSTREGIYVAWNTSCVKLDPATGKTLATFKLPPVPTAKGAPRWGYLNVEGDYLIGGADPLLDPKFLPAKAQGSGDDDAKPLSKSLSKVLKTLNNFSDNMSSSKHLVVMNRHTGEILWQVTARHGFRHNGTCVGGGRLYTIDRLSGDQLARLKLTVEELDEPYRLRTFDLATGKELWNASTDVFGTWLSYSAKHDVVVEAGRYNRDVLRDEPKGMRAYDASTGKALWYQKAFLGPAMIHGDMILQDTGACDLLTGAVKMREDPITGEKTPWKWTRTYGCNTPSASEHLLTFRSGAAGYFDLCNDGGTGNFGGFRSSCTNNLMVAGGIITAPEFTRTCTCSYQNQTSVALIHMPEVEMWTYFGTKDLKGSVKRLGLNFGAPGDRKADDGTLWIEYPSTGGVSPLVDVQVTPKTPEAYRRFPGLFTGPYNWVTASGVKGLQSVTIPLGRTKGSRIYTVRLLFAEPDTVTAGQRRFHVEIQGQRKLTDFDVVRASGGPQRGIVQEFPGVIAGATLVVRLIPSDSTTLPTVLSGLELVEEAP